MPRIPLLPEAGLSPEQRKVYDKIVAGPRGMVVGPLRAVLHSPDLADRWSSLGEFLRYKCALEPRLTELAILVCGRYWNSNLEWYIHSEIGRTAGIELHVIEAIRSSQPPFFENRDEAIVYNYSRELIERAQVSDSLYGEALGLFGAAPLVELTAVIGYYTMVAMTLNAHDVTIPEESPDEYRTLDARASAPGGNPTRLPPALTRLLAPVQRKA